MLKIWFLFYLVLLLRFSGIRSNGMVNRDIHVGVDELTVNNADNPTELLELVRTMSLELIRLANEQRKTNVVVEELLSTKEELQETRKELLTTTAELLKTQNKLLSSQSELHHRIKDLEEESHHFQIKAQVGVDALAVNNAHNPKEHLELESKTSFELIRMANEQRKMNAVIDELQETRKELLTSNEELHSRIKDLEEEVNHLKTKDRMRRLAPSHVGFTARLTNTITLGLNSHQTLIFDNVYINVGNGYDASTGVFHAPVAGIYVILMTVSADGSFLSDDVEVVHNGEPLCRAVAPHMNYGGCSCNAVVRLKVGDAVWVREIYHRSDDHIRGSYYTTFSMGLIIKDDDGSSSF